METEAIPVRNSKESNKSVETISILVVDDDTTCLAIVSAMLKKFKYEVVTVKHPNDALCILRIKNGAFDLVVSDIHMPDIDGFELQRTISQEFDLPVVLMSGDDKAVALSGLENGAAFFIVKPVCADDLRDLWQFAAMKRKSQVVIKEVEVPTEEGNNQHHEDNTVSESSVNENKMKEKRKPSTQEGSEENKGETSQSGSQKKPKIVWNNSLHNQFLEAIRILGLDRAVPRRILEIMKVPGLTRENIASHLQKYRIFLKRVSDASYKIQYSDGKGLSSKKHLNGPSFISTETNPSLSIFNSFNKIQTQIHLPSSSGLSSLAPHQASSSLLTIQPRFGQYPRLLSGTGIPSGSNANLVPQSNHTGNLSGPNANLIPQANHTGIPSGSIANLVPQSNHTGNLSGPNANLIPQANRTGIPSGSNANLVPQSNHTGNLSGPNANLIPQTNRTGIPSGSNANLVPQSNHTGNLSGSNANLIPQANRTGNQSGSHANLVPQTTVTPVGLAQNTYQTNPGLQKGFSLPNISPVQDVPAGFHQGSTTGTNRFNTNIIREISFKQNSAAWNPSIVSSRLESNLHTNYVGYGVPNIPNVGESGYNQRPNGPNSLIGAANDPKNNMNIPAISRSENTSADFDLLSQFLGIPPSPSSSSLLHASERLSHVIADYQSLLQPSSLPLSENNIENGLEVNPQPAISNQMFDLPEYNPPQVDDGDLHSILKTPVNAQNLSQNNIGENVTSSTFYSSTTYWSNIVSSFKQTPYQQVQEGSSVQQFNNSSQLNETLIVPNEQVGNNLADSAKPYAPFQFPRAPEPVIEDEIDDDFLESFLVSTPYEDNDL